MYYGLQHGHGQLEKTTRIIVTGITVFMGDLIRTPKFNIWNKIDNIIAQLEYPQMLIPGILKMCLRDIMTVI